MKKASDRSTEATVWGSVVSSTNSRSSFSAERSTSGPSDDPPIPHSTIVRAVMDLAHDRRSSASSAMRRWTSSHPSRSGASLPSGHSVMSRASSRSASAWGASGIEGVGFIAQCLDELVEALDERRHAFFLERPAHVFHVDADLGEGLEVV